MKVLSLFLVVVSLYGCATTGQVTYKKDGATQAEIDTANRECKYDVAKATQNNRYLVSFGDAIASGINQGMETNRLMALCLESKGFVKTQVTQQVEANAKQ